MNETIKKKAEKIDHQEAGSTEGTSLVPPIALVLMSRVLQASARLGSLKTEPAKRQRLEDETGLLTISDLVEESGTSRSTIVRAIKSGALKARHVGRLVRIKRTDWDAYCSRRTRKT